MASPDPLTCSEFHRHIEAAVDRTETVDRSRMEHHAAQCEECLDTWQRFVLMETAIERWCRRDAQVDLADRIISRLRNGTQAPHSSADESVGGDVSRTAPAVVPSVQSDEDFFIPVPQRRSILPTVATVALVLVAGTLVMLERRQQETAQDGNRDPDDPYAVVHVRPGDVPPIPAVPGTDIRTQPADVQLPHLLADARSAWQGLADRAAEQTRGLGVFVPTSAADFGLEPATGTSTSDDAVEPSTAPAGIERTLDLFYQATGFVESQAT